MRLDKHWTNTAGKPDGAVSIGEGFTIAWQRGPLSEGRNGAFLIEVLEAWQLAFELGHPLATGIGFTIAIAHGGNTLEERRSILASSLSACVAQLDWYQKGEFASEENAIARQSLVDAIDRLWAGDVEPIDHLLSQALAALNARLERRKTEGTLGTHKA